MGAGASCEIAARIGSSTEADLKAAVSGLPQADRAKVAAAVADAAAEPPDLTPEEIEELSKKNRGRESSTLGERERNGRLVKGRRPRAHACRTRNMGMRYPCCKKT